MTTLFGDAKVHRMPSLVVAVLLLGLVALIVPAEGSGGRLPEARTVDTCFATWSEPTRLWAAPPAFRDPTMAPSVLGGVVSGTDVPLFDAEPLPGQTLSLLSVGSGPLAPPPGSFWFVFPKIVPGRTDDEFHLFWGEPLPGAKPATRRDWPPLPVATLWHAVYREPLGWSEPTLLLEAPDLVWIDKFPSVIRGPDGDAHVAVIAAIPGKGREIHHFRIRVDSVTQQTIPGGFNAAQVSLAEVGDGTIAAAFVAYRGQAGPGIFFTTLTNDLWGTSVRLGIDEEIPTHPELRFGGGALHLFWSGESSQARMNIKHVVVSPSGLIIERRPTLEVTEEPLYAADIGIDECGRALVVWLDQSGPLPVLFYSSEEDGGWTPPRLALPPELGGFSPVLVAVDRSILLLATSVRSDGQGRMTDFALVRQEYRVQ